MSDVATDSAKRSVSVVLRWREHPICELLSALRCIRNFLGVVGQAKRLDENVAPTISEILGSLLNSSFLSSVLSILRNVAMFKSVFGDDECNSANSDTCGVVVACMQMCANLCSVSTDCARVVWKEVSMFGGDGGLVDALASAQRIKDEKAEAAAIAFVHNCVCGVSVEARERLNILVTGEKT